MLIEVTDIKEKVIIEGKEYYLIDTVSAEKLLSQNQVLKGENEQLKKDLNEIIYMVTELLILIGIFDKQTRNLKAELASNESSYIKVLAKALVSISGRITFAQISKKEMESLSEDFKFLEKVVPLIQRHVTNQKEVKL